MKELTRFNMNVEKSIVWRTVLNIIKFIMITSNVLLFLGIVYAVYKRYLTPSSFMGYEEFVRLMGMWLFFFGGAYCTLHRNHIVADVLSSVIKNKRVLFIRSIVISIISIAILFCMLVFSYRYMIWNIQLNKLSLSLHIPYWCDLLPWVIGFALMIIYTIHLMIQDICTYKTNTAEGGEN